MLRETPYERRDKTTRGGEIESGTSGRDVRGREHVGEKLADRQRVKTAGRKKGHFDLGL